MLYVEMSMANHTIHTNQNRTCIYDIDALRYPWHIHGKSYHSQKSESRLYL